MFCQAIFLACHRNWRVSFIGLMLHAQKASQKVADTQLPRIIVFPYISRHFWRYLWMSGSMSDLFEAFEWGKRADFVTLKYEMRATSWFLRRNVDKIFCRDLLPIKLRDETYKHSFIKRWNTKHFYVILSIYFYLCLYFTDYSLASDTNFSEYHWMDWCRIYGLNAVQLINGSLIVCDREMLNPIKSFFNYLQKNANTFK